MTRKKLALIDGSAAMFRAYYAMPALTTPAGLPTGAVYGYTQILQKVVRDLKVDLVAVFFDTREPTFRVELYADYKANRAAMPEDLAAQIPYIKQVTEALGIARLEQPGFEADDLIGTIARLADEEGYDVIVVSGDKDMLQLVSDHVCLYDPMKDKWLREAEVFERYGVTPEKVIEVMGLAGDTSDNVP
ncbi:MAG: DNA polymerase I, partial [Myxococcales bacterium]|nr:DNA polymerase I [Myxococcales bacterium]